MLICSFVTFPADGANLLDILHGDHAADEGQQHDGYNDELEQIDEDGADGLDVLGGDAGRIQEAQTNQNTSHHGDEDPCRQTELFLLHEGFLL